MSDNDSKGPVQVQSNDVLEVNSAFQQLVDRIDELGGLRGRAMIYDRTRVDDATVEQDALTLGKGMDLASAQTITGNKTFTGTIAFDGSTITITNGSGYIEITNSTFKFVDGNDTLIHSWGTITV